MRKRLTRTGNSFAVVLDKGLLEETGIDARTALEISTDGQVIVISPVRPAKRARKLGRVLAKAHLRYAGVFRKLAE